ncbi:hypothetical protein S245_055773, partial [Arachis hypogaea]
VMIAQSEMFHFYWIKDSRHRCTASFTHCQMTCPYNLLCWLCNWECDKDTVREGEHVFGVAHIFASFNDTFITASQVHGGQLAAGFVDGSVRLYDIRTPKIVEKVVGIGFQPGLDPRK